MVAARSEVHRAAALAVAPSVPEMGTPDVDAGLSTQLLHQKASSIPTLADGWYKMTALPVQVSVVQASMVRGPSLPA